MTAAGETGFPGLRAWPAAGQAGSAAGGGGGISAGNGCSAEQEAHRRGSAVEGSF